MTKGMKRTNQGNYFGYISGYYVFVYKRPHGKYCCRIGKGGEWLWREGYHGTSLQSLRKALVWANSKILFNL